MYEAGVHFGCSKSNRHPKMKQFLFGSKNNKEIFDLEKVHQKLEEAKEGVKELAKNKKSILFVGTKKDISGLVKKYAKESNMPYVPERWLGGTLTNFKTIKKRGDFFEDIIKKQDVNDFGEITKKEKLLLEKKAERLRHYFEGLTNLNNLPGALVVVDTKEEYIAVEEANKMSIPVIGIINSDSNPENINYPIPGNDNSINSVGLLLEEIVEAYKEGLKNVSESENEEEKKEEEE
jgi:small subunit ribosomal protein S2